MQRNLLLSSTLKKAAAVSSCCRLGFGIVWLLQQPAASIFRVELSNKLRCILLQHSEGQSSRIAQLV
jgi:hypothetical protein